MERNIKVFRAHRALACLYGLLAVCFTAAAMAGVGGNSGGDAITMAVFFTVVCAMHFFTARASREGKRAGRIASIVIACFLLLSFPVGTLIGIYLLVNTWKPWTASRPPMRGVST